jgi:hypothetical protein
LIQVNSQEAS